MEKKTMGKRVLALALSAGLAACGGGGGGSGGAAGPGTGGDTGTVAPPPATPVVALIAGGGEFTVAGGAVAPLACSASGGSAPYAFEWSVTDNAGLPLALASYSSAQTTFTAPSVSQSTKLGFQCKATDSKGVSANVKTSVTVSAPTQASKLTANAGLPFTAAPGSTNRLRCDGAGGVAPYSYQWRVTNNAGANLALSSYAGQETSFTAPAVGSSTTVGFECVVIDSANAGATGAVSSTIVPSTNGMSLVASAIPGVVLNPGQTGRLDGSGSGWFDSTGQKTTGATVAYKWTSSDPKIVITNDTAVSTNFVVPADYVASQPVLAQKPITFTLSATAGSEKSSTATTFLVDPFAPFTLSISPPAQGISLVASLGGIATATLTASVSAQGGAPTLYYQWTQTSGPEKTEPVPLGGFNTSTLGFSTKTMGKYVFNLTVGYSPISRQSPGILSSQATVDVGP
jgi:hypothetical protein